MKYDKSVITMTLHWHSSQVSNLGNYVDDTLTQTGLRVYKLHIQKIKYKGNFASGHSTMVVFATGHYSILSLLLDTL